jgi:hypothetical protein
LEMWQLIAFVWKQSLINQQLLSALTRSRREQLCLCTLVCSICLCFAPSPSLVHTNLKTAWRQSATVRCFSQGLRIWSIMRQSPRTVNLPKYRPRRVHPFCWNSCSRRYDCMLETKSNHRDAGASDLSKIDSAKVASRGSRSSSHSPSKSYIPRTW